MTDDVWVKYERSWPRNPAAPTSKTAPSSKLPFENCSRFQRRGELPLSSFTRRLYRCNRNDTLGAYHLVIDQPPDLTGTYGERRADEIKCRPFVRCFFRT